VQALYESAKREGPSGFVLRQGAEADGPAAHHSSGCHQAGLIKVQSASRD
jgi:hypothetical protein